MKENGNCLLLPEARQCGGDSCGGCGFSVMESKKRRTLFAKKGLTRRSDGRYRLVLPKEKENAHELEV